MNTTSAAALASGDPFEGLEIAWTSSELTLAEKAYVIASLHMRSRMTLEGTARMTGATSAQIQALLELATLDDEDLQRVSEANPPATTWFLFAGASSSAIKAGIDALGRPQSVEKSALLEVYEAIRTTVGLTPDERIAALPGKTLEYLQKKGIQYGGLDEWQAKFLRNISGQKRSGKTLTEKQLAKLREILILLAQKGAISRKSVDGDQALCNEVLDALGI